MSISITVRECIVAVPALELLSATHLPVVTAYRVAKLLRLVREEVALFHEQRNKYIEKNGTSRQPNEEEYARGARREVHEIVDVDQRLEFLKHEQELMDRSVEIEWTPLTLGSLSSLSAGIDGNTLYALGSLIVDDTVSPPAPPAPLQLV